MTSLTVLDFSGKNIRFERRGDRVWVSLTDMAKATGKQVGHWNVLDSTIEYVAKFESIIGIPIMTSSPGGSPETTGTWAIEEVAIKFAMWCNVEFEIWVTQQIRTLMTEGTVSIAPAAQPEPAKLGSSVAATISMLSPLKMLLSSAPDALVDGFLLNQVQVYHPEILEIKLITLPTGGGILADQPLYFAADGTLAITIASALLKMLAMLFVPARSGCIPFLGVVVFLLWFWCWHTGIFE